MRDVIPTGMSLDTRFLFERMAEATFAPLRAQAGRRVLDVATGIGQDAASVAGSGAFVVGIEPSGRMTDLARLAASERTGSQPHFVRGWGDVLPFASGSFDAVFCKGSIDHFDKPRQALRNLRRFRGSCRPPEEARHRSRFRLEARRLFPVTRRYRE